MDNIIDIREVAKKVSLQESDLLLYGNDKAKVCINNTSDNKGKLILVTAITPTPYGEGKTTVSIGLNDALCSLGKNSIVCLREPSMGPVFGMKGGATGGGLAQIIPSESINLHFTGDIHAITTANNLLCSAIDNHIYNGNELKIKEVTFNRCLDINDRALRNVNLEDRKESFNITAASEIMSILTLSSDLDDMRERLSNIIIGLNEDDAFVYAEELDIVGSLVAILKDAINPNLVQTLEGNPALVHCGPFANISFGCSSVRATKIGLSLSDYVITEAGFGADLGAEKFFDIKCRKSNLKPECIVLVATIKALKYHGDGNLEKGIENLSTHIENILKNNSNLIVALNRFDDDNEEDINFVKEICDNLDTEFSIVTSYKDGSNGSNDLAKKVIDRVKSNNNFDYIYPINLSIKDKLNILAKEIYRANNVNYSDEVTKKIELFEKNNISNVPICVSKTQYSLSDNKNNKNIGGYDIYVNDINLYNGAGFITILLGNIITMPGLPRNPNYKKIDVNNNEIIGIE